MTSAPAGGATQLTARPPLGRPSRVRRLGGRGNANLWFWVFVGPLFVGLLVFIYIPIGWSIYLSFFEARNTVSPAPEAFVGLRNYADMLGDPNFVSSLTTFLIFAAFIVPVTFALSLATAVLISRTRVAQAFFRSVFFLPTACSYVVAALIWKMSIFSGVRFGLANTILDWFGLETIPWLSITSPPWYWLVIISARLWLQIGFYMILFIAGLQRINPTLYEAAAIDGAEGWTAFRTITFPLLRPTNVAVLLLLLINAFQAFDEFFNILSTFSGYPPYARPPLVYLFYIALGQGQDFGHGGAGAVILTLTIAIVAVAFSRLFRTEQPT